MATGVAIIGVKGVSLVKLAMKGMDKINAFVTGYNANDATWWDRITWK